MSERLGATHHLWRPDVRRTVQTTLTQFSALTANTYKDHPWVGWDELSVDYWGRGGRGHRIPEHLTWPTVRFLMRMPGLPNIRHVIAEHSLWTSWGGWSFWADPDHEGRLEHVHVTYWP